MHTSFITVVLCMIYISLACWSINVLTQIFVLHVENVGELGKLIIELQYGIKKKPFRHAGTTSMHTRSHCACNLLLSYKVTHIHFLSCYYLCVVTVQQTETEHECKVTLSEVSSERVTLHSCTRAFHLL